MQCQWTKKKDKRTSNDVEKPTQKTKDIFVFGGHFVSWLPWQRPPF
jgi:hypothetical protein